MKFCKNKYFIENLQLSWILAEDTQPPPWRQSVRELKHPGLRFRNYIWWKARVEETEKGISAKKSKEKIGPPRRKNTKQFFPIQGHFYWFNFSLPSSKAISMGVCCV
jgi:hypothetical protein